MDKWIVEHRKLEGGAFDEMFVVSNGVDTLQFTERTYAEWAAIVLNERDKK